MSSFEDIENIIEEWFSDYKNQYGNVGVSKLYAKILLQSEKELQYHLRGKSEQK